MIGQQEEDRMVQIKMILIHMSLGKKLKIETGKEVKHRQISPAWDKESSQEKKCWIIAFSYGDFHGKLNHEWILEQMLVVCFNV